jgi:hypothetical protein
VKKIIQQNRHPDSKRIFAKRLFAQIRMSEGLVDLIDFEKQQVCARNEKYERTGCKQTERKNQSN